MKKGINPEYLIKNTDLATAAKLIAQAGFDEVDYTPNYKSDDWEKITQSDLKILKDNKLDVIQTHAPFNRYNSHGDNHEKYLWRALTQTAELGARYMVVHGDEFPFATEEYTTEKAIEHNYRLYYPIVEKATELGIKVAFENVFEDMNKPRLGSKAEDLKALIEKFNTDSVCCCWDFGHAHASFGDEQPEKILELGDYIKCTHFHDSWHRFDTHIIPFSGEIKWKNCTEAMKKINYNGSITFEMVYGTIPVKIMGDYVQYMKKVADCLEDMLI